MMLTYGGRICVLCQQDWLAVTERVHGLLGGLTNRFRYVTTVPSLFVETQCDFVALHYPYVLAFEPTFVEIRHVETGSLTQIIQGNNLRCLFADTPPSTTNSASQMSYNPHNPYGQQYNPYQQHPSPQMHQQNGYGTPYTNPYYGGRPPTSFGRDEIIMSSDDRVMRLQLAQLAQPVQVE